MRLKRDGTIGPRAGSQPPTQTRPYDFGTDAIERQRVSLGQAMMDADFEYGLQATKWQSYVDIRKFPSFFEIPGTDYPVSNVSSDGLGPNSNITVRYTGTNLSANLSSSAGYFRGPGRRVLYSNGQHRNFCKLYRQGRGSVWKYSVELYILAPCERVQWWSVYDSIYEYQF